MILTQYSTAALHSNGIMPSRVCIITTTTTTRGRARALRRRGAVIDFRARIMSRQRSLRAQLSRGAHGDCTMSSSDGMTSSSDGMTCSSSDGGDTAACHRRRCSGLTGCALLASEAAAHVARLCRSNPRLLSMLIQEKCGDDANSSRFAHDFKTLADVLVQRLVAKRIGRQV